MRPDASKRVFAVYAFYNDCLILGVIDGFAAVVADDVNVEPVGGARVVSRVVEGAELLPVRRWRCWGCWRLPTGMRMEEAPFSNGEVSDPPHGRGGRDALRECQIGRSPPPA